MALYPNYPIVTERLRLRPFTRGDVDAVFAYRRLEDVARYLFDKPLSRDQCATAVQRRIAQVAFEQESDKLILAAELIDGATLIGEVSLEWKNALARQGEVGWIFNPDYQGKGYATEAMQAVLTLGFGPADLHRITARCDARNGSSWRLMERLGMRREAHFREHAIFKGEWDEEFVYAILRREWISRQSQNL
jgi:RimJ/RimL family protein N-acetyltransferase